MSRSPVLAALVVTVVATAGAARAADDAEPYAAIPVEVGKAIVPTPDLLAAAKALREAAAARDVEAVFAMVADEVTIASSGITVGSKRSIAKTGPFADGKEVLSEIGGHFQEGDLLAGGRKVDLTAAHVDSALRVIVSSIDGADWGRDPLVKGGFCTYRGARWSADAGEKAGASGSRGFYVLGPTKALKSSAKGAATVATLKPGFLYVHGFMDGLADGWSAVRLPTGGVGAVPEKTLKDPVPWGLCFLPNVDGGWLVSAFASALL